MGRLDPELKRQWIDALRSGEYEKGRHALRQETPEGDRWCCLGVLCNVIDSSRWSQMKRGESMSADQTVYVYDNDNSSFVPTHLALSLGLMTHDDYYSGPFGYGVQTELSRLNDSSDTFEPIIEFIEKEL